MWDKTKGDNCDKDCKTCDKDQNEYCLAIFNLTEEVEEEERKIDAQLTMSCVRPNKENNLLWVFDVLQTLFMEQKINLREATFAAASMYNTEEEEGHI